jgi:iron complex outermembrane receptor protein
MNRTVLLGALLAAPLLSYAQESTQLDAVVVVGTRSEESQNRLPAAITLLTRQQITDSGVTTLADALRLAGGVQMTDFFGDGSRVNVDLRGLGDGANAGTLVLVDGRRLNNPDIASPDLQSVSLKDVERIEIIQGSAGTLYGDQAVGGVINIVTRSAEGQLRADGEIGYGSYDAMRAQASVSQLLKSGFSYRASAEARGTDNYRDHNHLEYENLLGRAGYAYRSGAIFLEGGWVNERLQTPGALFASELAQDRRQATTNFRGDFSNLRTNLQRANWRHAIGEDWNVETDVTHRRSDGTFRLSFASGPATADSSQDRNVWTVNPRVTGHFALPAGDALVTAGIDAQRADYELTSPFGTQSNTQELRDAYAQLVAPLWWTLEATAGARTARVENEVLDGFIFVDTTRFHDTVTVFESGLSLRPLKDLRLFARRDGNVRFAKVDEFTSAGAPPESNENRLQTQTGVTWEAGAEWRTLRHRLSALLYRLDLRNEIVFDPDTFSNVNLQRTRRDGILVEASTRPIDRLELAMAGHYLDAGVRGGNFSGRQIPLVARTTGRVSAGVSLPWHLHAYTELLATGARRFSGDFGNTLGKLPGHAVVNLALSSRHGAWRVAGRINNLFDREYAEYGAAAFDANFTQQPSYFPSPERNFWLSLSYSFSRQR